MGRFTIGIVKRGQNSHVSCFEEFAAAMADALRQLGHEVVGFENPGRLIMFGANNIVDPHQQMPPDAIFYNAEQLVAFDSVKTQMADLERYKQRKNVVWDYSELNVKKLVGEGVAAVLCPVGYMPCMTSIEPMTEDIDVLFYGSLNNRRSAVLEKLKEKGLKVVSIFDVYGKQRDEAIARAKVVLNIHFYERPIFEIFRCSHLFANRKCVVTEGGSLDHDLEALAARSSRCTSYDGLVDACVDLVRNKDRRERWAEFGFEEFKRIDLVENVRQALELS